MISDGSVGIKSTCRFRVKSKSMLCVFFFLVHGSSFNQNFFILSKRHASQCASKNPFFLIEAATCDEILTLCINDSLLFWACSLLLKPGPLHQRSKLCNLLSPKM